MRRLRPSSVLPASPRSAARADDGYGATALPDWRTVDWRAHLHRVEVDGREVAYVDLGRGEGPPVVFVHGLGGSWQNWLENLPRVARERRAIALDLPGFGASQMPAGEVAITSYARAVDGLCELLGLGAVAVVGNSMGGFVAADLAIAAPERVERLVLVDAAGIAVTEIYRAPAMTFMRLLGAAATRWGTAARLPARPGARHLAFALVIRHPTRLRADLLYEQAMGAGSPGYAQALSALASYDFRDRLPEIACPTLIVQGADDMLVPVADAHEFARLIADARTMILPDTGHVPMLERPQAFNDVLMAFLEGDINEQLARREHEPGVRSQP